MNYPSVLFMICHDLGTHLTCYGDTSAKTPYLDELATQSVRFSNYFASAPQCSPSRGSIITGRYPHSNGLMGLNNDNRWNLNEDEVAFPEILRDAGYETRCFGTWHINHDPTVFGIERKVQDRPASEIAVFFDEYLSSRSDKPFLCYLGFFEPHRDFGIGRYEPEDPREIWVPPYLPDNDFTRKDLAQFHAAVREMDKAVGDVLKSLEENGLSENTIVIFTSDHGIAFPRAKCTLYDPGLKTPLIIRVPAVFPENRVFSELMSNTDLAPSLLDMLDLPVPDNVHGRSFVPLIKGQQYDQHKHIFAEKTYHNVYDPMRAIRTDRFKYILNFEDGPMFVMPRDVEVSLTAKGIDEKGRLRPRPREELYDLNNDPNEFNNLTDDPQYEAVRNDLNHGLLSFLQETGDPILEGPIPEPPPFGEQDSP
jgi:arylsulfatase A-like enzyme